MQAYLIVLVYEIRSKLGDLKITDCVVGDHTGAIGLSDEAPRYPNCRQDGLNPTDTEVRTRIGGPTNSEKGEEEETPIQLRKGNTDKADATSHHERSEWNYEECAYRPRGHSDNSGRGERVFQEIVVLDRWLSAIR